MIPIDQTIFGFTEGNCYAACLASILELPLKGVPNFCAAKDAWPDNAHQWLLDCFGFSVITILYNDFAKNYYKDTYAILGGQSPRGQSRNEGHACVWINGRIIHDPHPSKDGLIEPDEITFILAADPSILTKRRSL